MRIFETAGLNHCCYYLHVHSREPSPMPGDGAITSYHRQPVDPAAQGLALV